MKTRMTTAIVSGSHATTPTRRLRWFGHYVERQTEDCVDALRHRTNDLALLRLAGGNPWLARRAIEIYKRRLCYAEPEANTTDWDVDKYDDEGLPLFYGYT